MQKLKNQVEFVFCVNDIQQPREGGGPGIHVRERKSQTIQTEDILLYCQSTSRLLDTYLLDNIRVIKLLKPRDLSYGNWVHPLSLSVQADSFKRHHFSRQLVFGFVHNSVRALSDLFHFLEVLHEALASRVSPALERGPGNPAENGTQLSGAEEGNRAQHRDPRSGWNAVYLPLLSICPT